MHKLAYGLCALVCLILLGCAERTGVEPVLLAEQSQSPWYFLSPQEYQHLYKVQNGELQEQGVSKGSVLSEAFAETLAKVGVSTIVHLPSITPEKIKPFKGVVLNTHASFDAQILHKDRAYAHILSSDISSGFVQHVRTLFLDPNSQLELDVFGDELNEGLAQSTCEMGCLVPSIFSDTEQGAELLLLQNLYADASSPAQKARQMNLAQRIRLYLSFQYTIFGTPLLSQGDLVLASSKPEWHDLYRSLANLRDDFGATLQQAPKVYYANNEEKLFAYQKQNKDGTRIYIVFNLSFDIHVMPLPLGFMNSTKIKLWQTDTIQIENFVTDQPLMIRAFSAAIVIVE